MIFLNNFLFLFSQYDNAPNLGLYKYPHGCVYMLRRKLKRWVQKGKTKKL